MFPESNNIIKLSNEALEQKRQYDGHTFDEEAKYLVITDMDKIRFSIPKDRNRKRVLPPHYFGTRDEATTLSYNEVTDWIHHLSHIKLETETKPNKERIGM